MNIFIKNITGSLQEKRKETVPMSPSRKKDRRKSKKDRRMSGAGVVVSLSSRQDRRQKKERRRSFVSKIRQQVGTSEVEKPKEPRKLDINYIAIV
ncbi:hypothetical protein ACFL6N_03680 [Thermodesulfobacteriota bacterium]